jgi:hypothetical protein
VRGRGKHPLRHVRVKAKRPSDQSERGWFDASVDVNAGGRLEPDAPPRHRAAEARRAGGQGIGWSAVVGLREIPYWSLSMQLAKRHAVLAGGWRLAPAADVG